MNILENEMILELSNNPYKSQRDLAQKMGYSLGSINKAIKELIDKNYLNTNMIVTNKAKEELKKNKTKNAIILAAGYGMRMVPINTSIPKGLIEINGEPLIERLIKQLKEVEINEIYIVVGFLKEKYEYLIDKYNVQLIVNSEYDTKNNLHSLNKVMDKINNTYILPCDIWCKNNPFRKSELYSWYMVDKSKTDTSNIKIDRNYNLKLVNQKEYGNAMIGISYIKESEKEILKKNINTCSMNKKFDNSFWECALINKNEIIVKARIAEYNDIVEINTYEQLRELDEKSNQLKADAIEIIEKVFNVQNEEIKDITILKKGMTNRSFLFKCKGDKYIMRIPGEGTDLLINRKEETSVYNTIKGIKICDDIYYINPTNGYKITKYINNARVCNSSNWKDVNKCMKKLRDFHDLKLKVNHDFNLFKQIDFYESLWNTKSIYRDYRETKENVKSLKEYIDNLEKEKVLTHIDAVPDNFLFYKENNEEKIKLIDWEYSGMQDPHVDIAMFCIYSLYDKSQIDKTIDLYFDNKCSKENRIKIYCYISICGLLWSNWCEYKRNLGVDFGEYSLKQYRYAKEYYRIAKHEISDIQKEKYCNE